MSTATTLLPSRVRPMPTTTQGTEPTLQLVVLGSDGGGFQLNRTEGIDGEERIEGEASGTAVRFEWKRVADFRSGRSVLYPASGRRALSCCCRFSFRRVPDRQPT
jgi:hypothetical protein